MRRHPWLGLFTASVALVLPVALPLIAQQTPAAAQSTAEEKPQQNAQAATPPATSTQPETWKVGLAKAKITPQEPMWLAGYGGRDRASEGTLHDLRIKVLALETPGGDRAVVLTSDLLGFPKNMYDRICAELDTRSGLKPAQVMLTASHTHTGPVLRDALYDIYPLDDEQRARIERYSAALEKTVVETIEKALAEPTPATLWAGQGTAGFAVNRRNNREPQVPELLDQGAPLVGPVDHDVPVLAVRGPGENLQAVLFGYACHATTLAFYRWSGDYPGFAQIALEADHPGALAMFHAGCGADQNPLPRRSVARCGKYGFTLAEAVENVLQKPMRPIAPRLRTALEIIELDFDKPLSREQLEAAVAKGSYPARRAGRLLKQLDEGRPLATSYPYPVQVWKLGEDQLWIALGGEVVVDYSLRFKSAYGPQTWTSGYTNDVMAYIPSHRVWEEGGYESGAFSVYGLPTDRWSEEIEDKIAACVERLVEKLDSTK